MTYPLNLLVMVIVGLGDTHAQSGIPMDDLKSLRVKQEDWCSRYDRNDYFYPRSIESEIIHIQGRMYSPYDLTCFSSPHQSDVKHIVAIAETHRSGMCAQGKREREQFASELLNLTLATPELNRNLKVAKDAPEWLPPDNQCWYAGRIIAVKKKHQLSVDKAEKLHSIVFCNVAKAHQWIFLSVIGDGLIGEDQSWK